MLPAFLQFQRINLVSKVDRHIPNEPSLDVLIRIQKLVPFEPNLRCLPVVFDLH